MPDLPHQARAVVIGGGIAGCSTAYHLAKLGWTEILLLERHKLTSGSTFHAAGLVGQLRSSANITQLLGESVKLYGRLAEETGLESGWKANGGLRLACTADRWTELRRQATTARSFGVEMHLVTPEEARSMWPLMHTSDVLGAAFLPGDGQANPSDITQALAKGARMNGVRIFEDTPVTGVERDRGRVRAVLTAHGRIECDVVANCAGQWARELARMTGVNVPLVSVEHQYVVTKPIEGVSPDLPTLRDPDRLIYFKEEVGGLVLGGYERNPIPWAVDGIPTNFNYTLLDSNWSQFEQFLEPAMDRVPALAEADIDTLMNGPESFTPDGNFILGEAPEVRNYFVAAGFNAFGIAAGGGAGMALAEWIAHGEPPFDLWAADIRRFGQPHREIEWVRQRALESYSKHYTIAWPNEERETGRPCRRSPLYERLREQGACFGEKLGWERPNWFADSPEDAFEDLTFGRPRSFGRVALEHRATREKVALFDQSSFAKFEFVGPDAEAALSWICANDVRRPPGTIVYTQMLNRHGGVECDVTVARLAEDRFYIVTGTASANHDADWIRRTTPPDLDAHLVDVTSARAVISVMGPRARDVLQRVTRDDVGNDAFPFGTLKEIGIAGAPVRAQRLTYVGELGWELHIPTENALGVYDSLMAAGREFGVTNAGYKAIETLRLEKGYRAWGAEVGPDYTPLESGLSWAVKLSSGVPFLGREALEAQERSGTRRRLAGFTLDDPEVVLLGRETLLRDGEQVGWLTSGGFGHTIGKPIGYGFVRDADGIDTAQLQSGRYELIVANERVPCTAHLRPLYDPGMRRVKA